MASAARAASSALLARTIPREPVHPPQRPPRRHSPAVAARLRDGSALRGALRNRASCSSSPPEPRLAHEWIVDGKVVPSSGDGGAGEDGEVVVFLHGLLGNAKNLRTPAQKLTRRLPRLRALLLDLRGHGRSAASAAFAPPHDFRACVRDVVATLAPLGLTGRRRSPVAIVGHSLGGRIALEYAHALCAAARRPAPRGTPEGDAAVAPPAQTWLLDTVPGRPHPSAHRVLRAISALPLPGIASKAGLVETLVQEHGLGRGAARRMAANVRERETEGEAAPSYEWTFDAGIARELVEDFSRQDFEGRVREVTAAGEAARSASTVHLVTAGRNAAWSEAVVSRLQALPSFRKSGAPPSAAAAASPSFQMHTLEKAGHWVHADDSEGFLKLMVEKLQPQ